MSEREERSKLADVMKRELRISSDQDYRQWPEIERAVIAAMPSVTDLSDQVERLAAFLIARDESEYIGVTPKLLEWGAMQVCAGKESPHGGDCTKESYSCPRCSYEMAIRDAHAAIAAMAAPAAGEPVAWQCQDKHGRWITMPGDWTESENVMGYTYRPLYAAPPQEVQEPTRAQIAQAFETIRLKLVKCLEEPERSAFWLAVHMRDALTRPDREETKP